MRYLRLRSYMIIYLNYSDFVDCIGPLIGNVVKASVDSALSNYVSNLEANTEKQEQKISDLMVKNLELKESNKQMNGRVDLIGNDLEELQQYGRRNSLRSDEYVGCFIDTDTRLLPHEYVLEGGTFHSVMENNMCWLHCKEQGYIYFGTEAAMFCFCGDDPYRYGPENVTDNYIMDSDCNSKCIGDPEQICGGVWRLSVYKSETGVHGVNNPPSEDKLIKLDNSDFSQNDLPHIDFSNH
ncbi:unnamed protein product [Mytilus edulis]|uniref:WSC domain-containing protein n=1 Tax=Mytilus edulis TaxID=6550 RepID=A0A8S3Q7X0_MYTED|nr:unnamed protein product [Mytilus edulis]